MENIFYFTIFYFLHNIFIIKSQICLIRLLEFIKIIVKNKWNVLEAVCLNLKLCVLDKNTIKSSWTNFLIFKQLN